jgi:hypothetical protein
MLDLAQGVPHIVCCSEYAAAGTTCAAALVVCGYSSGGGMYMLHMLISLLHVGDMPWQALCC